MITSETIIKEQKKEETPKVLTPEVKATKASEVHPANLVQEIEAFLKSVENQSSEAITYLIKLIAHHKDVTKTK
jgi:hypothetical protein